MTHRMTDPVAALAAMLPADPGDDSAWHSAARAVVEGPAGIEAIPVERFIDVGMIAARLRGHVCIGQRVVPGNQRDCAVCQHWLQQRNEGDTPPDSG